MEKPPARKLPKKSQRPKRRYILFSFKQGSCSSAKQAFDLIMGQFDADERKELGVWFIKFEPAAGKGIVRCKLGSVSVVRKRIESIAKQFEAKTMQTSGTLRKLGHL